MNTKIIFIILYIVIVSDSIFAQTPEYSVNIDIKNKSLEIGESTLYILHLRGGGFCDGAYLKIDTDGIMEFEGGVTISQRIDEGKPTKIELEENFTQSCISGNEVVSYETRDTGSPGTLGINLRISFPKSQFNDIEMRGLVKPLENSQSGEYDIRATFFCLNNGKWYNFFDEESFKVFLKVEKEQFITAEKAFITAVIALIISFFGVFLQWCTPKTLNDKTIITNVFRRIWYKIKTFFKNK